MQIEKSEEDGEEASEQVISSNKSTKRKNKEKVKIETDQNGSSPPAMSVEDSPLNNPKTL